MNNKEKIDFAISSFIVLERQMSECMEYLPFIDANRQAISPKFIPIIMDACSLIDSILFEITSDKKKRRFNLKEYSKLREPELMLDNNISLFLISPVQILCPYKGWTQSQPDWWNAYNSLKHDRLNNYHFATFTNAISSLAGLHQLMTRQREYIGGFLKAGWIDTSDEDLTFDLTASVYENTILQFVVESKLFASAARENFVNPETSDETFIDIDYDTNGLSDRIRNMMMAREDW